MGGMTDLNASQKGKFQGKITAAKRLEIRELLTESWSERLMSDDSSLVLVLDCQLFILQEAFRVVDVVLQEVDALIDFAFRLCNWFTHFLSNQPGVSRLVLLQDILQITHFLEPTVETQMPLSVLVAETLVGAVNVFF